MTINRSILLASAALCALVAAPRAGAQAVAASGPAGVTASAAQSAGNDVDIAPEDMPAARRLLDDEALHRDRLARIRRLRELATEANLRDRLAQLDDLERRENDRHEARRLLERSEMSERSFASVDGLRERHGAIRLHHMRREAEIASSGNHSAGAADRTATTPRPAAPMRPVSRPAAMRPTSGARGPR